MSDRELLRRSTVDYTDYFGIYNIDESNYFSKNSCNTHNTYYNYHEFLGQQTSFHSIDIQSISTSPINGLMNLFGRNNDFVDFNFITIGQYKPGSQYNALDGHDKVILPNDAAKAQLAGYDPDKVFQGGDGNDQIFGGTLNDTIQGNVGDDSLFGGGGNDSLEGSDGNDEIWGGLGDDVLSGGNNDDILIGAHGQDILFGDNGNDFLDGGGGADTLEGGKGDDIYIFSSTNDKIIEKANEGIDTVHSSITYTLGNGPSDEIENLTLVGTDDLNGTGNDLNNIIIGNFGANQIDGGAGQDIIKGGDGSDILSGGDDFDNLFGGLGEDVLSGGSGNDFLSGGTGKDILTGNDGIDSFGFQVGQGADSVDLADVIMDFEDGTDVLFIGALKPAQILILNEGNDAVLFSEETNQYICVIKNCAGLITEADFAANP